MTQIITSNKSFLRKQGQVNTKLVVVSRHKCSRIVYQHHGYLRYQIGPGDRHHRGQRGLQYLWCHKCLRTFQRSTHSPRLVPHLPRLLHLRFDSHCPFCGLGGRKSPMVGGLDHGHLLQWIHHPHGLKCQDRKMVASHCQKYQKESLSEYKYDWREFDHSDT